MPKQIIRLAIAFAFFIALFLVIRNIMVPDDFYKYGHYRAGALDDNAGKDVKYVGSAACATCHAKIDTVKTAGLHGAINCETCHGPGYMHIAEPIKNKMEVLSEREFCAKCHMKNDARPEFVKQVDVEKHNPGGKCITCHNPHYPGMKKIASNPTDTSNGPQKAELIDKESCAMCHSSQMTLLKSGIHKSVDCQSCHGPGSIHIENPSANKLGKPNSREFCGKCHGKGIASASSKVTQVDINEHNSGGKCTECHHPHSPYKDF